MIPYFTQPAWQIGPLTLQAFGVTIAVAMWLGLRMYERRIEQLGLDQATARQLTSWVLVGGILGAHLFSVALYFPDKLRSDPWLVFRVWEDISSFGGMLGGIAAALAFFEFRTGGRETTHRWAYLDVLAFVFPTTLAIGRFGCALAHDHLGRVTSNPVAFSLETTPARALLENAYASAGRSLPDDASSLGFYDLGLLECVFLTLVIVPLFRYWNQQRRPVGFYLVAFAALYLPVRFLLDMLRVTDVRYSGLTPAQWVAAAIVPTLPFFVVERRSWRFVLGGALLLVTGWACTSGAR
jgi:phosphatidylglycerol---prolipoprotein diacylglyceryl transferase